MVLIPGSKSTLSDLEGFRAAGWDIDLQAHLRRGGTVVGLCAGYQMMGHTVSDPDGIEGRPGSTPGLGLLDAETVLTHDKKLTEERASELSTGQPVRGYEMHMGRTTGPALARPMLRLAGRTDGAISADGKVLGCYLHGLFASDDFRSAFLARFRQGREAGPAYEAQVEETLDRLADHLEEHADVDGLLALAQR